MPLIRNIHETEMNTVQMEGVQGASMSVMIGRDDQAPHFAMRSFAVQPGGHTPKHQHDYEHEVYVVSGNAQVLLEGEQHELKAGDAVLVPANELHQFTVPESASEPFRFLCFVPIEQNCGGPVPGS
ncbi:MAG: cupin domain-containing protein [Phycisphaerales bacterium]|nr:cupin domain-containing protein [Phycisphaerales bacterium]